MIRLTIGAAMVEVLRDGRVLVTLPAAPQPFGAVVTATALYPSLRAFLTAMRKREALAAEHTTGC